MSRLMIVVEFEVKPEHRSAFVELMKGHAQRSRAEDGCQQFDVLVPQEDQSSVFLVEAWRDQAALDVHIKLPAMAPAARGLAALARQHEGDPLHRGLAKRRGFSTTPRSRYNVSGDFPARPPPILCSGAPSNGPTGKVFRSARPAARAS